jgi:hypothetical protein
VIGETVGVTVVTNEEIDVLTRRLFEAHPDLVDLVKRLDFVGAINRTGSLLNLIPPPRDDSKLGNGFMSLCSR